MPRAVFTVNSAGQEAPPNSTTTMTITEQELREEIAQLRATVAIYKHLLERLKN